jgi:hypothetical protein
MPIAVTLCGCAAAPLKESGALSSYNDLQPANGTVTKSLLRIDADAVLAAKTARIVPTTFAAATLQVPFTDQQRQLIGNAVDRSLCIGLSDRFRVVPASEPADLTVHAVITNVTATDKVAAGASKVVSIIPAALSLGVPVPVPRLPIGLGSLSMEAEAQGPTGDQTAAMIWARGANSFGNRPRVSTASDAYDLAASFGGDFSEFLVTGKSPFGHLSTPSMQKISASLGSSPKYAACAVFGKDPGVGGMIAGGILGAPPEWTDDGAAEASSQPTAATAEAEANH